MNKPATLKKLKARLAAVVPEFEDDEGAFEHQAEIQSVIDVIEAGAADKDILHAAGWVGLVSDMVLS